MKIRQLAIAAALAVTAASAQATLYTYTGNWDENSLDYDGYRPRRLVAQFDLDVADPASAQAGTYQVKSWEIQGGDNWFFSSEYHQLTSEFHFDAHNRITSWYFTTGWSNDPGDGPSTRAGASSTSGHLPPSSPLSWIAHAWDFVEFSEPYYGTSLVISLMDQPGTWTMEGAEVPEPASLGLVTIGAAAWAGARRRRRATV